MDNRPPAQKQLGGYAERRDYVLEFFGLFMVLFAAKLLMFTLGYEVSSEEISVEALVASGLTDLGFCLLVPILLTRRGAFDWKLPYTSKEWAKEFGWALLLLLAVLGCQALVFFLTPFLESPQPTHWSDPMADPAVMATFCLFTPIIGLSEELLFRVYAQTRLTQVLRGRRVLPVLVGAGLFAVVHGYALLGTLGVFVIGLVFGLSYQANGRIPRLVIAHTLWNLAVVLLGLV